MIIEAPITFRLDVLLLDRTHDWLDLHRPDIRGTLRVANVTVTGILDDGQAIELDLKGPLEGGFKIRPAAPDETALFDATRHQRERLAASRLDSPREAL